MKEITGQRHMAVFDGNGEKNLKKIRKILFEKLTNKIFGAIINRNRQVDYVVWIEDRN